MNRVIEVQTILRYDAACPLPPPPGWAPSVAVNGQFYGVARFWRLARPTVKYACHHLVNERVLFHAAAMEAIRSVVVGDWILRRLRYSEQEEELRQHRGMLGTQSCDMMNDGHCCRRCPSRRLVMYFISLAGSFDTNSWQVHITNIARSQIVWNGTNFDWWQTGN